MKIKVKVLGQSEAKSEAKSEIKIVITKNGQYFTVADAVAEEFGRQYEDIDIILKGPRRFVTGSTALKEGDEIQVRFFPRPCEWDVKHIGVWLTMSGFDRYRKALKVAQVDGQKFMKMTKEELQQIIGQSEDVNKIIEQRSKLK